MAWKCVKVEEQREYLVKSYVSKAASMSELCEECGVSRTTGYKWYYRYLEEVESGLLDQSRAPKFPKRKFSEEQMKVALELKQKRPKYGPSKIAALLARKFPDQAWPSSTRLYHLFREHHLICSRKLRRRVPRTHPLGQVNASNDVWCADFKGWFLTEDQSKIEPLTITDGYSRFVIRCLHLERKRSIDVWRVYSEAFHEYGLPLRIRTDNGPPFATTGVGRLSSLSVNLIKAGVIPEWINPGHPEENGRHERFHRSLKEAVASPPANTFSEQIVRMGAFTDEYNFDRPHEALGQQTPGSYYDPSPRQWDGILRAPEYDSKEMAIRKVCSNGCIHWKRLECYLGKVLSNEYVGLREAGNGYYRVFYGPVFLGTLIEGEGFKRPEFPKKKSRRAFVNHVSE